MKPLLHWTPIRTKPSKQRCGRIFPIAQCSQLPTAFRPSWTRTEYCMVGTAWSAASTLTVEQGIGERASGRARFTGKAVGRQQIEVLRVGTKHRTRIGTILAASCKAGCEEKTENLILCALPRRELLLQRFMSTLRYYRAINAYRVAVVAT